MVSGVTVEAAEIKFMAKQYKYLCESFSISYVAANPNGLRQSDTSGSLVSLSYRQWYM